MTPNLSVVIAVLPAIVVGLLLPLAIVGLVAYGIAELVRAGSELPADGEGGRLDTGTSSVPAASPATSSAVTILDERFARGEIDPEDYVQRRELLLAPVGIADPPSDDGSDPTRTDTVEPAPTDTVAVEPAPTDTVAVAPTGTGEDAERDMDVGASGTPEPLPAEEATGEQPATGTQPPATA